MKIAVIAVQGDVGEHVEACKKAMEEMGIDGEVVDTISPKDVRESDAIILPGGESTTISKLIYKNNMAGEIKRAAKDGKPIMGTCAGSILMAKHGDEQIEKTKTRLLELMDIWVKRNAFGRQKESFQTLLPLKYIGEFKAVFIRAPAIIKAGENVEVLAKLDEYIVAARQDNLIALSFHPELADDVRVHKFFLEISR